jgi:hypothetical protein
VQGVAQKGYRATSHHDNGLDPRRQEQDDEGDRNGPDAISTPFQRLIQRVLGIMRVRSHQSPKDTEETAMPVVVVVPMTVGVDMGSGLVRVGS